MQTEISAPFSFSIYQLKPPPERSHPARLERLEFCKQHYQWAMTCLVHYSDLNEPTEAHVGWFTVIGMDLPLDMLYRFNMEGKHHRFHS